MDRETKVIKRGVQQGSLFNDRVSIEFSPSELETLKRVFEQRAIDATRYNEQGDERNICEVFTKAYEMWKKLSFNPLFPESIARKEKKK